MVVWHLTSSKSPFVVVVVGESGRSHTHVDVANVGGGGRLEEGGGCDDAAADPIKTWARVVVSQ